MHTHFIPFQQVRQFTKTDINYTNGTKDLDSFYTYSVDLESFDKVIQQRKQYPTDRAVLVETLQKQYAQLSEKTQATEENIALLTQENTFTIITAHQPSLFTGPLYFIYKIISVIRLTQELKKAYPLYNFVPMFVIGGEDHDFDEVNFIHIFNKKLTWENAESGAVGMMNTVSLQTVLAELQGVLGESDNAKKIFEKINQAYSKHSSYGTATQDFIHTLFGKYGLVVADMNEKSFKKLFIPIMEKELFEQPSKQFVADTQTALNNLGYKSQAYPREINLFYLRSQLRARIEEKNGVFQVVGTDLSFTKAELLQELHENPQHFSPNVVLRPLFQETIMPNLAYIGGGGEIAYWLERKSQFAYFGVHFPMLMRRNSVLMVDAASSNRLSKFNIPVTQLFEDTDFIIKEYVKNQSSQELSLANERKEMQGIFDKIEALALQIDPTLQKTVAAEKVKQLGVIEQLEGRLVRAEKQKHDVAINQIRNLSQKFFPNGSLQERTENFLPYYLKYGDTFFDLLLENLNPLNKNFVVLEE